MRRRRASDLLGRGGVVHLVDASPRAAASRSSAGSRTEASTTRWCRVSVGSTGSSPSSTADGSSGVSSTTSARCRPSAGDRAGQGGPVGLGDHRLEVGHRVLEVRGDVAGTGRAQPGADPPVAGHEVDPVAGAGGERGEQQRGVHRGVEPGHVVDPAGRGARGVEHQHHPAVALGLPGAHHDVAVAGAWPASRSSGRRRRGRTRAASRTRCPGRAPGPPTRPSRSRSRASRLGRCLRDSNGGSERTVPGDVEGALPRGQARAARERGRSRRRRAGRRGVGAAAAVRSSTRSPGASREPVPVVAWRRRSAARRRAPAPRTRRRPALRDEQHRLGVGCPSRTVPTGRPLDDERRRATARAASRRATSTTTASSQSQTVPTRRAQHHRHQAQQEQQRDPPGDAPSAARSVSAGTGTEPSAEASTWPTSTPSSSASGRSPSRCTRVAWASALTSSGVTKSRPVSQAQARAARSSAVAPRGLTPRLSDGDSRVARAMSTM